MWERKGGSSTILTHTQKLTENKLRLLSDAKSCHNIKTKTRDAGEESAVDPPIKLKSTGIKAVAPRGEYTFIKSSRIISMEGAEPLFFYTGKNKSSPCQSY